MVKKRRLVPTAGDLEVFRWLWMLRVMTLEQIRRVRYYQPETGRLSSFDNVRKRLKRLWDADYLSGDRLLETNERIYFLGQQALGPLRECYGVDQQKLYQPRGFDTMQQLLHPLLVSECAVRVTEALRGTDMKLVDLQPLEVPFYHTHAVGDPSAKKHVKRFVTQEDVVVRGQPEPFRIRPDLVFSLKQGDASRLFFLEADRNTESPKEIVKKQLGYAAYAATPDSQSPRQFLWQRYSAAKDLQVLFLTTAHRRVGLLQKHLADQPGFDLMAFTSIEELQGKNMVFDGVWTTETGSERPLATRDEDS